MTQPNLDGALCVANPDLFTRDPEHNDRHTTAKAIAICEWCPVVRPCLEWALSDRTLLGVLGGTTYAERKRLMRWKRIA